jgi:hypothetical protein
LCLLTLRFCLRSTTLLNSLYTAPIPLSLWHVLFLWATFRCQSFVIFQALLAFQFLNFKHEKDQLFLFLSSSPLLFSTKNGPHYCLLVQRKNNKFLMGHKFYSFFHTSLFDIHKQILIKVHFGKLNYIHKQLEVRTSMRLDRWTHTTHTYITKLSMHLNEFKRVD